MSVRGRRQRIAELYGSMGPRRAAALGAGLLAALALVVGGVLAIAATGRSGRRDAINIKKPSAALQGTTPAAMARRAARASSNPSAHRASAAHPRAHPAAIGAAGTPHGSSGGGTGRAFGSSGGAGGGGVQANGSFTVSFGFHAGGSASISACGATHHYRTYPPGTTVSFSGTVSPIPSADWKVKLSIKVCQGGVFQDFTKVEATRNKHRGTFKGSFSAPSGGLYWARAELYVNDSVTAESDKHHFATP